MPKLYLTPASISYLTQFILSLAIGLFLLRHLLLRKDRSTQTMLLSGFFAFVILFSGLLFLDTATLPSLRLYFVYMENTVLAGVLVLLIQFAYRFPVLYAWRKKEAFIVLGLSLLYMAYEAQYAIRINDCACTGTIQQYSFNHFVVRG